MTQHANMVAIWQVRLNHLPSVTTEENRILCSNIVKIHKSALKSAIIDYFGLYRELDGEGVWKSIMFLPRYSILLSTS